MNDFYDTLGVSRNADAKEIKSAYRKVAMKFHPDKNPGDSAAEDKFKAAAEAYSVLSDDQKRARYDQFGHQAYNQGGGINPQYTQTTNHAKKTILTMNFLFGLLFSI